MTFQAKVEKRASGREVVALSDDATGAAASILPSYGFNLFDLRLPVAGEPRAIVVSATNWADDPKGPAGNGVPILFPYPNRVRAGRFTFGGRTFELPITNGPNAIHGFAMDASWTLASHGVDASGAYAVGRYHMSTDSPKSVAMWPTDAIVEVRYQLAGRKLTMTTTVSNPTDRELPYGLGFHPYFRIPFPPGGDASETSVIVPAAKSWVLDSVLPTGEVRSVDSRLDFRGGQPRKGLKLDDVLTGLSFDAGQCVCRLVDRAKGGEFRLGFDASFREVVLYTPPSRDDVIAIEPYTQTTDAINLQPRGIDAGLRVLGHGASARHVVTMETVG
jgi:aldose 1-epimerase